MRFLLVIFTALNIYVMRCPTMSVSHYGQLVCIALGAGILLNFIMGLIIRVLESENDILWFLFNGFTIDVETIGGYFRKNLLGLIIWLAFAVCAYLGISNII